MGCTTNFGSERMKPEKEEWYKSKIQKVNDKADEMTAKARENKYKEKSFFRKLYEAILHLLSTWLGIKSFIIVFIACAICVTLDQIYYRNPNMWSLIKSPGGEAYWDLFEAQVGISMVGLSIVTLLISFVKTKAYGMSIPMYVMQIRPWYWDYKSIIFISIATIPLNWFVIMLHGYNTAVLIVVLNCILHINTVDKAFNVIYSPDEIIYEIANYILTTHKEKDMINFYNDMIFNIETKNMFELDKELIILKGIILKQNGVMAINFLRKYALYMDYMYGLVKFPTTYDDEMYMGIIKIILSSYCKVKHDGVADNEILELVELRKMILEDEQKNNPSNKSSDDFMRKSVYDKLYNNTL